MSEKQKKLRTMISIFALAYEEFDLSFIPDAQYDKLALEIDTSITTDNAELDKFFKEHYTSATGIWVYAHPELGKVRSKVVSIAIHLGLIDFDEMFKRRKK